MPGIVGDYNLAAVQITLGTFRVDGFGEDDALVITPSADLVSYVSSADGKHVSVSSIVAPPHEAELTVRRGTTAWKLTKEPKGLTHCRGFVHGVKT